MMVSGSRVVTPSVGNVALELLPAEYRRLRAGSDQGAIGLEDDACVSETTCVQLICFSCWKTRVVHRAKHRVL